MDGMLSLGFDFQDNAMLTTMSQELVSSWEIESEVLNLTEVRSSIAAASVLKPYSWSPHPVM